MAEKSVKIRKSWAINPATRVKISKKVYSRRKVKQELKRIVEDEKKGA